MKTATQYQNKTPAEIAHQYKKGLRAKQGLLILILLLYVADSIRGIWWADDSMADVLFKLLILIVITFPINIWISWNFMSLNQILNQACDSVTYVQVMRLLGKVHKRKRNALAIRINEASGLMWSGQFAEKMENLEGAMQVKPETEAFVSSFTKASIQKTGRELLDIMDASLAFWRGDYETFCRIEEARSARYTAKIQKVVSAVCLADVDIAYKELENARTRLEYAIREGGTLYVVEDARHMLAELAQKERMEGTGYGEETVKI